MPHPQEQANASQPRIGNVTYVLPDADFFSRGHGGAVAHAKGVVEGLVQSGYSVTVIADANGAALFGREAVQFIALPPRARGRIAQNISSMLDTVGTGISVDGCASDETVLMRKSLLILVGYPFSKRMRDLVRASVIEVNGLSVEGVSPPWLERVARAVSRLAHKIVLRRARGVYTTTEALAHDLTRGPLAVHATRLRTVPNGVPASSPEECGPATPSGQVAKLDVLFFGKFQPYNDFQTMAEAAARLEERFPGRFRFAILGFGALEQVVAGLAHANPSIEARGPASLGEVRGLLASRDRPAVGLIPLVEGSVAAYLSPVKAYDYIALRIPLVSTSNATITNDIRRFGLGWTYAPGCARQLEDVLVQASEAMASTPLRAHLHAGLERAAYELSWANRAMSILELTR